MPDSLPAAVSLVRYIGWLTRCLAHRTPFLTIFCLFAPFILLSSSLSGLARAASPDGAPKQMMALATGQTAPDAAPDSTSDAVWPDGPPFVASTPEVIEHMMGIAAVKAGDVVYDIGSGDGVVVIQAAKAYGARGVGIEIDAELVGRSRASAVREKVDHLVEFHCQDAFAAEISSATVVTLYMLPDFNAKFRPLMERQLKPGTRVVTHDYPIPGWVPDRVETYREESGREHRVMLFTPPRR